MKTQTLSLIALLVSHLSAHADISICAADGETRAIAESYQARWKAAIDKGVPSELSALYAESAVLMPPTDETVVGNTPISAYLSQAELPAAAAEYSVDLVSCELRGNSLHLAGVWGAKVEHGALTTGNLMRVLEPGQDGRWVSRYEIWN
jgi:ketosteroid isomerase-like protein